MSCMQSAHCTMRDDHEVRRRVAACRADRPLHTLTVWTCGVVPISLDDGPVRRVGASSRGTRTKLRAAGAIQRSSAQRRATPARICTRKRANTSRTRPFESHTFPTQMIRSLSRTIEPLTHAYGTCYPARSQLDAASNAGDWLGLFLADYCMPVFGGSVKMLSSLSTFGPGSLTYVTACADYNCSTTHSKRMPVAMNNLLIDGRPSAPYIRPDRSLTHLESLAQPRMLLLAETGLLGTCRRHR